MLGRLNHPGIVTVFDSGMAGPCAYLIMEYVDGVNLRQAMQSGGFTPVEALAVTQEICSALEYAHGQGILHRDIKPENILIDSTGRVKIADFGIAKLVGDQGPDHATLTMKGAVLGSMSYMAPEQFDAPGDVDQRADIYSLGVVLYELLTGELPRGRFGPPSDKSAVDARIDEIVMRTLEREREARFQNVHQMKTQMYAATQPGSAARSAKTGAVGPKTARFANVSLICTVLSVPVAMFAMGLLLPLWAAQKRGQLVPGGFYIVAALLLLLLSATAISGALLGLRALREIRASGGQKAGFARAIIASLGWPALLMIAMSSTGISALLSGRNESTFRTTLLGTLLLGASLLGAVMMRRIYNWVKNSQSQEWPRKHVQMFALASLAGLLGLAATLPDASTWDTTFRWNLKRPSRPQEPEKTGSEPAETKLEASLVAPAGKLVKFRFVTEDARGKETPVGIEGVMVSADNEAFKSTLRVASTGVERGSPELRQPLTATFETPDGKTKSQTAFIEGNWKFRNLGRGSIALDWAEKQGFYIATIHPDDDFEGETLATLVLRFEIISRPQKPGNSADETETFAIDIGTLEFSSATELMRKLKPASPVEKQP